MPYFGGAKHIAEILNRFDDKIELNQKINENLERQAQAIYTSIFIADAKTNWQPGHFSDLVTVRFGKDHKKLANGNYPVFGSCGVMRYVERPLYDQESVLIPRKGTLNFAETYDWGNQFLRGEYSEKAFC